MKIKEAKNNKVNTEDRLDGLEKDLGELKAISQDIHTILVQQGERLDKVEDDVLDANMLTGRAISEVKKATEYQPKMLKTLAGGFTGLALAGPVGWSLGLTGLTLGLVCSGGAIVGLSSGFK